MEQYAKLKARLKEKNTNITCQILRIYAEKQSDNRTANYHNIVSAVCVILRAERREPMQCKYIDIAWDMIEYCEELPVRYFCTVKKMWGKEWTEKDAEIARSIALKKRIK